MPPRREFPINFKRSTSEEIDDLRHEYHITPERLARLARATTLFTLHRGGGMTLGTFYFNPRYMTHALQNTGGVRDPEDQVHALRQLAQKPASHDIMAEELDSFYGRVAKVCRWLKTAGHGRVPYIHRRNLSLLGIGSTGVAIPSINQEAAESLRRLLGRAEAQSYMPVLPNPDLDNYKGIAEEASWFLPGGEENSAAVMDKLSPVARLLIGAAQVVTEPVPFDRPGA